MPTGLGAIKPGKMRIGALTIVRCKVNLPAAWIDASMMETAIQRAGDPHGAGIYEVGFRFRVGSKLMIDAAITPAVVLSTLKHSSRHRLMLNIVPEWRPIMRTTVALDGDLVAKAQAYTGLTEKSSLIREALKALIERESASHLARLGGTERDYAK